MLTDANVVDSDSVVPVVEEVVEEAVVEVPAVEELIEVEETLESGESAEVLITEPVDGNLYDTVVGNTYYLGIFLFVVLLVAYFGYKFLKRK